MKELKDKLESEDLQQIISILKGWPLLHFSNNAKGIGNEGFLYGAELKNINMTRSGEDQDKLVGNGNYHFAFNVLEYCYERDAPDYMVGVDSNLMGMYAESAILFIGDGIYTRHYDEFNQVIFKSDNVREESFLLLESQGLATDEDGLVCDENGNNFDFWVVKDKEGNVLLGGSEVMTLEECVKEATYYLLSHFKAAPKAYEEYQLMFNDMPSPIMPKESEVAKKRFKIK